VADDSGSKIESQEDFMAELLFGLIFEALIVVQSCKLHWHCTPKVCTKSLFTSRDVIKSAFLLQTY
jgi:hypothetical protein